jgi:tyrosyl-tRNA synthetase
MTIFEELKRRGLIAQMSHEKDIEEMFGSESVKFYVGFDATADSLHIGHMMQLITMKRLQQAGHYPIALLGTATTLIGDPTGKTDMRKMLTHEDIAHNADCFAKQFARFVDFSEGKGEIVKNGDWFSDIKYLEFLRDVGRHFSVNKMLSAECFKVRLEKGLSFLEFNYMLLQSYDFLHLYRTKGVKLQIGGDDQWSNILAGADLVRRYKNEVDGCLGESEQATGAAPAFAMTFALLAAKSGKKMGKTEKGAIWLDPEKCSVYDFYQHFRNTDDADVIHHLKMMTFVPVEEIEDMDKTLSGTAGINSAKELLAFEMTKLVHGEEAAVKARDAAKAVFAGGGVSEDMPTVSVGESRMNILDLLVSAKLCGSKRDARTNVEQGGVSVDDVKITDVNAEVEIGEAVIVKKGKKNIIKIIV